MRPVSLLTIFAAMTLLPGPASAAPPPREKIQHIIVISLENHSFDNLFGLFPRAEGFSHARRTTRQVDLRGFGYTRLPPVRDTRRPSPNLDDRFPRNLPNQPFAIEHYVPEGITGDLVHRFYQEQAQIDGGRMDRFAAISDAGALTMGYYDGSKLGLWRYAKEYTLADHFFHAAFGGSFLNHFWLVCACTPLFPHAPQALVAELDNNGVTKDGSVTPDGHAVNTLFSAQSPHPPVRDTSVLLPPQDLPTIGDRLSAKGIRWAWYSGGWNNAVAGKPDKSFQFHHQPFAYFRAYHEQSEARRIHLKDEADLMADLRHDTLPAVVFFKPLGEFNLHPGYASVDSGDAHTVALLQAIEQSKAWASSVIIVTFDENGGYWDHMPPPKIDRWGPGVRVPTLIISPLAKRHFVDHTLYDTTSILKLIEWRFDLAPLGTRDAAAHNLLNALALP